MASLLINLFYSCQSFGRHTPAVLSPTAVIQVKMLTRGVVAVELRREKSFPRLLYLDLYVLGDDALIS